MDVSRRLSIVYLVIFICHSQTQAQSSTPDISSSSTVPGQVDPAQSVQSSSLATSAGNSLDTSSITDTPEPPQMTSTPSAQATDSSGITTPTASPAEPETTSKEETESTSTESPSFSIPSMSPSSSSAPLLTSSSSDPLPPSSSSASLPPSSSSASLLPSSSSASLPPIQSSSKSISSSDASKPATTPVTSTSVPPPLPSSVPTLSPTASSSVQPSSSVAPPITTPPTAAPPTTSYPAFAGNVDIALYTLKLNMKEVAKPNACNRSTFYSEVAAKLRGTMGYVSLEDSGEFNFDALYRAIALQGVANATIIQDLQNALSNNPTCYNYTTEAFEASLGEFAALTSSYCSASFICQTGYTCSIVNDKPLCISICEGKTCQNGGSCEVVVDKDGTASVSCSCVSSYDNIYTGDNCEIARMNPERVAAIVGGVLGAICFILLVALYCMCYRKRGSQGKKYE